MKTRSSLRCARSAPSIHSARSIRSAFSLIEILLAIAILLVALLGVAAVFPRVLLTQQDASRSVSALPQEEQAKATLLARERTGPEFWTAWAEQAPANLPGNPPIPAPPEGVFTLPIDGRWHVPSIFADDIPSFPVTGVPTLPVPHGSLVIGTVIREAQQAFGSNAATPFLRDRRVIIPLKERLRLDNPDSPTSAGSVWDIAIRRAKRRDFGGNLSPGFSPIAGNSQVDSSVQIAVFVRPLDSRLGVIPGEQNNSVKSLREALYSRWGALPASDRRLPVSAGATDGIPTNDGLFVDRSYSNLMRAEVSVGISSTNNTGQLLEVFEIEGALPNDNPLAPPGRFEELIRFMRVPGQVLVSAIDGSVIEVAASTASDPLTTVRLTKPVTTFGIVYQVVFSPQKPSRVSVFVANPPGR